jgi:hypothetical protein
MTTNRSNIILVKLIEGLFYSVNSLSLEPFAYERQFRLETDIVYGKEKSK